ncbi:uncharacterized protein RCH25_017987 [Pelodytes ibericus]
MEIVAFVFLLGLFAGPLRCSEPSLSVPPLLYLAPMWPPRHAQDLVQLIGGAKPLCSGQGTPHFPSKDLSRWRQLIGSLSKLLLEADYRDLLLGVLKEVFPAGGTQGGFKQLLLWGISHNVSWNFLNLPLVSYPLENRFLGVSLKPEPSVFLQSCTDRLLPGFQKACQAEYSSRTGIIQSLCLLTSSHQTIEMGMDLCGFISSLLSDLLSDPCSTSSGRARRIRTMRSLDINCDYTLWHDASTVSAADVSTCSESDKEGFVYSVCGNQNLLNQLASQPANNWLIGFCAFNSKDICKYSSWVNTAVSDFSVTYCWLYDEDQFQQFLCSNQTFFDLLTKNPKYGWPDLTCSTTEPPQIQDSFSILQQICNYTHWQFIQLDPTMVAFCAENDRDAFTYFVCQSPDILLQLLNSMSSDSLGGLCENSATILMFCQYAAWSESSNKNQLVLASDVSPTTVLLCSQIDEEQFVMSMCNNISLLLAVTKNTNNSWVRDFCSIHLPTLNDMCNYTAWSSAVPGPLALRLCWFFYQEQLELYLCSNPLILQKVTNIVILGLNCYPNSTEAPSCNNSIGTLSSMYSSMLEYCAGQDASSFQQYICKNATLLTQLVSNTENSWIPTFCAAGINVNISTKCPEWTSNFLLLSCPNCSKTDEDKLVPSICSDQDLVQTLGTLSNHTELLNQVIVWRYCIYSSWITVHPPLFLVSYCWTFDQANFAEFLCSDQTFYEAISTNLTLHQTSLDCQSPQKCHYVDWSPGSQTWIGPVNISTVSFCSQEDSRNFLASVCNDPWILHGISDVPALTWTLSFCYNVSSANVLSQALVLSVCNYSHSADLAPFLMEFCWMYDQKNFFDNLCADSSLYIFLKTQPKNFWIQYVCFPQTSSVVQNFSSLQCQYNIWDPSQLSLLRFCAEHNTEHFMKTFCNGSQDNSSMLSSICELGQKLCSYQRWQGRYIHPGVVKLCWVSDQFNFSSQVCADSSLIDQLLQDPKNTWLRLVCEVKNEDPVKGLVGVVCRYGQWQALEIIPPLVIALCKTYNRDNYPSSGMCKNSSGIWWDQAAVCDYANWKTSTTAIDKTAMCWAMDRANFTDQVCAQPDLLYKLSNDPPTAWVSQICSISSFPTEPAACLSEEDKKQLAWQCSANLSIVCPGEGLTILNVLPLSLCFLQNSGLSLDIPSITSLYTKNVDLSITFLLLLEEMGMLAMSGSEMLKASALQHVLHLLAQNHFPADQKTDILQTFGNTLIQITGEEASTDSWILIEEFFNLPLSSMAVSLSRLSPEAAKIFLNILSKNVTVFKVPDEYLSLLVSIILKGQVTSKPELFADLVPFLHYLKPYEMIQLLPPMQDNKEILQAIGLESGSLSTDQRVALGIWLQKSLTFQNISSLSDVFIQQMANLLPLLPLNIFQQLSGQQVVRILPSLPVDLPPAYQRIVASRVLQEPNITVQDVELMGPSVCQAGVQNLALHRQNQDIFLVLKKSLLQCVKRADLYPDTKMLDFLFGDVRWQDSPSLSWQSLTDMTPLLPALGYTYLQALQPDQLLPVLSDVGSLMLTPAQARILVQKIQIDGTAPQATMSNLGSLVLGLSPNSVQQLSTNQLTELLPALSNHSAFLSGAQVLAVIRTLWTTGNIPNRLQDLGPLLYSLPLIQLRSISHEILSDLGRASGVKWNLQQAQFLFRETAQTNALKGGILILGNLVTGADCNYLLSLLRNDIIQTMTYIRDNITRLPARLVQCVLDELAKVTLTPQLMKSVSSQISADIPPPAVSLLAPQSCMNLLQSLKSEIQFVTELPQPRRLALMNALIHCLGLAGLSTPQEQFVTFGFLTPFLSNTTFLSIYRAILTQSLESVTKYCYLSDTQTQLTQLLQEPQMFGTPTQWPSLVLHRLDRLVSLLPDPSIKSISRSFLSNNWVLQIFSEENNWKKSPLGAGCIQSESPDQSAMRIARQRTLLRQSLLAQSSLRTTLAAPDCQTLRGSAASTWGADIVVRMSPVDFLDCLEDIGQDRGFTSTELVSLLTKFLEISGPLAEVPPLSVAQLGRLATKLSGYQLRQLPLANMQVMDALGREREWTVGQLQALVRGFLRSNSLSVQDLDALHLVTLGYVVCGFSSVDMEKLQAYEFCSAVLHLGSLLLSCTEEQFHALTRLCTHSDTFGPVSNWREDIFREMGSVAAGLEDIELSSLVLEQIQGLSPLAVSLMAPMKFAVSFSATQLLMFSWSQAMGVTDEQKKQLDPEQQKALTLVITGENNGTQYYRVGLSHAGHCSLCPVLMCCTLLPVLRVLLIV